MATTFAPKTMNAKQSALIAALIEERHAPMGLIGRYTEDMLSVDASDLIGKLLKCPKKDGKPLVKKATTELVGPGIYVLGGTYYKVQKGKNSSKCYALAYNGHKWVYTKGAIFSLTASHKATAEQAKQFATKYGSCCNCHKTLTVKKSVDLGYGPVCAKQNGWPY